MVKLAVLLFVLFMPCNALAATPSFWFVVADSTVNFDTYYSDPSHSLDHLPASYGGGNGITCVITDGDTPPVPDGAYILGRSYSEIFGDSTLAAVYDGIVPPRVSDSPLAPKTYHKPFGVFWGLEKEMGL